VRLQSHLEGRVLFGRIENDHSSWMDARTGSTLRFADRIREPGTRREDDYRIDLERKRWINRLRSEDRGRLITDAPLDELAFLAHVRAMELKPGDRVVLRRHFRENDNPVHIAAEAWEEVEVPAGRFRALRIRVRFARARLFNSGGSAVLWLADLPGRPLVRMTSEVPVLGSADMRLVRLTDANESPAKSDPFVRDATAPQPRPEMDN
jgi:hypothetical protein